VVAFAFVSHGEAAVAEEPGYGSFDLPPVPSQALGRLDARRAIREAMPRLRSQAIVSAEW
jgi:hypothetical protein